MRKMTKRCRTMGETASVTETTSETETTRLAGRTKVKSREDCLLWLGAGWLLVNVPWPRAPPPLTSVVRCVTNGGERKGA